MADCKRILELFLVYLKIGAFTIGGGYVMLAYVQREIVEKHKWVEEKEFLNMLALAQAAPGLIAVNTAIFVGWCVSGGKHRWAYIAAAVLGATLPSIVCILLIAMLFREFKDMPEVEAVFKGVRPAVVALIGATVIRLARKVW
jgi:chromate transporter